MKRLLLLFVGLAVLVALPFVIWGDWFEEFFSLEKSRAFLEQKGVWSGAVGIGLLAADLVLPIPGTAVMSALGLVHGPVVGGLLGATGSILGGLAGYGFCRWQGRPLAVRLVGDKDLATGERFFARHGGWAVALSRWLPVFPEVLACLAGVSRMSFGRFFTSLVAGSLPMALLYAWIGHAGRAYPGPVLLASAIVPAILWGLVSWLILRRKAAT